MSKPAATPVTVETVAAHVAPLLDSLANRWVDEQQYEDFSEYEAAVAKQIPLPFKLYKLTQDFVCRFADPATREGMELKVGKKAVTSKPWTAPAPKAEKAPKEPSLREKLPTMSLAALAAVYNTYAEKKIKAFSGSKDKAIERVLGVLPADKPAGSRPRVGSGARIRELLTEGKMTPKEILETILKEFPTSRATVKDVYWQRNKMKQEAV